MRKRILITCGTSILAIRLSNMLKGNYDLVLATSDDIPSVFIDRYQRIPKGVNPTFAHEVLKVAIAMSCDFVMPLGKTELYSLAEAALLFQEYEVNLLAPDLQELANIDFLLNPDKDIPLHLMFNGVDLLSNEQQSVRTNGLGIITDGESSSFVLTLTD